MGCRKHFKPQGTQEWNPHASSSALHQNNKGLAFAILNFECFERSHSSCGTLDSDKMRHGVRLNGKITKRNGFKLKFSLCNSGPPFRGTTLNRRKHLWAKKQKKKLGLPTLPLGTTPFIKEKMQKHPIQSRSQSPNQVPKQIYATAQEN